MMALVGQDCILRGDLQSPPACQGRLEIGRSLQSCPTTLAVKA
jgi:hypothetical protein